MQGRIALGACVALTVSPATGQIAVPPPGPPPAREASAFNYGPSFRPQSATTKPTPKPVEDTTPIAPISLAARSIPLPVRDGGVVCEPVQCVQDASGALWLEFVVVGSDWGATVVTFSALGDGVQQGTLFVHADGRTNAEVEAARRQARGNQPESRPPATFVCKLLQFKYADGGWLPTSHANGEPLRWVATRFRLKGEDVRPLEGGFVRVVLSDGFLKRAEALSRWRAGVSDDVPGPYFEYRDKLVPTVTELRVDRP